MLDSLQHDGWSLAATSTTSLPGFALALLAVSCQMAIFAAASAAVEHLQAGDAALARGELTAAVRHYSAAVELDDNSAMLFAKRAAAYFSLRQNAQARPRAHAQLHRTPTPPAPANWQCATAPTPAGSAATPCPPHWPAAHGACAGAA
jgi:hypothetical protein